MRSPNELSRELGDPLGNVSYHVRILRELDCVELVRTEQRRGALEHYYRATASPGSTTSSGPACRRRSAARRSGRTLSEILEGASAAQPRGWLRPPRGQVVDRVELELDEQGWSDVVKLLNDTLEAALADPVRERAAAGRARCGRRRIHPHRARHPALSPRRRRSGLAACSRAPDHHDLPSRRMTKTALRWTLLVELRRRARRPGADRGRPRPRGPASSASARRSSIGWWRWRWRLTSAATARRPRG